MAISWEKLYKRYKGLWVALDEDEKTVLSSGKTVKEVVEKVKKKTDKTPFLTRVPQKMVSYVGKI